MSGRPARVHGRQTFAALGRSSRRANDGLVRVHFVPSPDGDEGVHVAYAVGRKVGGAVIRNRCRRRLRAIAAEASDGLAPGAYLVVAGPALTNMAYDELRRRVVETMRRASKASR